MGFERDELIKYRINRAKETVNDENVTFTMWKI